MLIMLSLLLTAVYLRVGEGPGAGHAVLHGPRHHREQHQVRLLVPRQLLPAGGQKLLVDQGRGAISLEESEGQHGVRQC